jgi:hypothetical protein
MSQTSTTETSTKFPSTSHTSHDDSTTSKTQHSIKKRTHSFTYESDVLTKRVRVDIPKEIGCIAFYYKIHFPFVKIATEYTLITNKSFVRGLMKKLNWKELERKMVEDLNLGVVYVRGFKEAQILKDNLTRVNVRMLQTDRDFNNDRNRYCHECKRGCSYKKAKALLELVNNKSL